MVGQEVEVFIPTPDKTEKICEYCEKGEPPQLFEMSPGKYYHEDCFEEYTEILCRDLCSEEELKQMEEDRLRFK